MGDEDDPAGLVPNAALSATRKQRTHYWRIHKKNPGALSEGALKEMREFLCGFDASEDSELVGRACVSRFLLQGVVPVHSPKALGDERWRLLRSLAYTVDHMLQGHLDSAMDIIVFLIKAELKAHKDRNWTTVKCLQLLHPDNMGSATNADEEEMLQNIAVSDTKYSKLSKEVGS